MKHDICTNMGEINLVDDAGHWVQQEQPESVTNLLTNFLGSIP